MWANNEPCLRTAVNTSPYCIYLPTNYHSLFATVLRITYLNTIKQEDDSEIALIFFRYNFSLLCEVVSKLLHLIPQLFIIGSANISIRHRPQGMKDKPIHLSYLKIFRPQV